MARQGKLNPLAVGRTRKPGRYSDGGGLYLQVGPTGGKSWLFRFSRQGRARAMGLGSVADVPLARARKLATECREQLAEGRDPIGAAREKQAAQAHTFAHCAEAYIAAHEASWRNGKHRAQWRSTLATYATPALGKLPVAAIELAHVLRVLEPIWRAKPETASRLRGRIEAILDWAAVKGYRSGDNPARWRGHLAKLLPARGKVQRVRHHAALPFAEIGAFMSELRAAGGVGSLALQFTILTAARTGEALGARWTEIDMAARVWTVPAARMKSGREHRVPLSEAALEILERAQLFSDGMHVFPGGKPGRPLSPMAMLMTLRRMGRSDLTAHGFRSCFRDWAAECTSFPTEVAEAALAHVVSDRVEAAYRRGDLFSKRQQLMAAWAQQCSPPPAGGVVLPFGVARQR